MTIRIFQCMLGILFLGVTGCKAQTVQSKIAEDGNISPVQSMATSRATHTATLLSSGKVLIAGGFSSDRSGLASTEIFDPATKTFTKGGDMNAARLSHTATRLPDGRVLIAGGFDGEYLDSAEIYDPKTGRFALAGKMTVPRSDHIAVLLKNGKVLIAGGVGTGWTFLSDAELYDPATNRFTKTGNMTAARESHTATLLTNGQVLITGGHKGRRSAIEIYSSAELYDPKTGLFIATSEMTIRRHKHGAVLLNDGRVLIVGGSDERDDRGAYKNVEVYDPSTKRFSAAGEMTSPRYKLNGTAVLLKSGKVLIAGGSDRAEVFDPSTGTFSPIQNGFESTRLFTTATLLPEGSILIAGGYDSRTRVSSNAWIYSSKKTS